MFVMVLSTPRPAPEAVRAATGHEFHFADRDEIQRLAGEAGSNLLERDVVSLERGGRCLVQYEGSALVGYTWVSDSPLIDVAWGFHLNLPDDTVYNYNGFTTKPYRGTSFQALRHLKVLERVREEGKRRLLGFVDHMNFASLRGVAKSGYEQVGVLCGVRRNGKVRFTLTLDERSWGRATRLGPLQRS